MVRAAEPFGVHPRPPRAPQPQFRPENTVYVSAAVAWEIAIKKALGKLDAPDDLEAMMAANRFLPLPVTIPHALAVASLPPIHNDPFDRPLIAQARHEGFKLVSRDRQVASYGPPHIIA